ncbi:lipid storage droplets surface-binding protein 1 isoform X2 [Chrysoperla carnea]|uniref:lipid storage droplets surface-binding protein 1 isoform X2 n=1 Tax=Chrysoperla carnea TaxID=189513 RepID=UPI001D067F46|nr:lipid storage droplets surface-binding protein 1 isoform X2 [Chrysoperla carnea]
MRHGTVRRRNTDLPHLESISRIQNIPIVESSWAYANQFYTGLKRSNSFAAWGCETAERSINFAFDSTVPLAVGILGNGPISAMDKLVCKSLDILDQRVPSLYLPPQMMYWNTKQYMNTKLVTPMLKRADSVKYLGNQVLTSKYTEFAADSLDNALNVADKYVDTYLPAESGTEDAEIKQAKVSEQNSGKAVKTLHHVDRLSRKLKRRITRHAIAEAKALKKQSKEAIHVMVYVAELIATDPKLALKKAQELWAALSKDEPENQARPQTVEQLIVMITRETARRLVHLINHTSSRMTKLPNQINRTARGITIQFLHVADTLVKRIHLEGVKNRAMNEAKSQYEKLRSILQFLNAFANNTLERLAITVAGGSSTTHSQLPTRKTKQNSDQTNFGFAPTTPVPPKSTPPNSTPPENENKNSSPNRNKHSTNTVTKRNNNHRPEIKSNNHNNSHSLHPVENSNTNYSSFE